MELGGGGWDLCLGILLGFCCSFLGGGGGVVGGAARGCWYISDFRPGHVVGCCTAGSVTISHDPKETPKGRMTPGDMGCFGSSPLGFVCSITERAVFQEHILFPEEPISDNTVMKMRPERTISEERIL